MKAINSLREFLNKKHLFNTHYKPLGILKSDFNYYYYKVIKNTNIESTTFLNKNIKRVNPYSFIHTVEGIFIEKLYEFKTSNVTPIIIDCGSNIGLSIIYFKQLFPNAQIIGFEPDKPIFEACKFNLEQFNYNDVQLKNSGVWKFDGTVKFVSDNSLGGAIVEDESENSTSNINVEDLAKYLKQKVDFLKIDIEGAEIEVLEHVKDLLTNVENIFVEYHCYTNKPQNLTTLLNILSGAGFRYYIKHAWDYLDHPYSEHSKYSNQIYDLQLNIFGYRKN